ncbi:MAG: hypothetical protein IKO93_07010, partial [Lentisphaeria bacterium]|nr:hypothetical protein [Lentisphaeria bacterium]
VSNFIMMLVSLPLLMILYPSGGFMDWRSLLFPLGAWMLFFIFGQTSFFLALREIESSRLASLLGLKIVILTLIFMLFKHQNPKAGQWAAVIMASGAAFLINWSGKRWEIGLKGAVFVLFTLIGYSMLDICENAVVMFFFDSGMSNLKSSLLTSSCCYTLNGLVSLPCLYRLKVSRRQITLGTPCALFWLGSQIALMSCFALLQPVFANVILASRGLIAVLLGAALPFFGIRNLDAAISRKQWILRGFAALLMIAAIGLYSLSAKAG